MKKIVLKLTFILLIVSIVVCFVYTNDVLAQNGEGCSPGFWKQSQHFGSWVGFDQDDDFETVFGVDASSTTTLLGALNQGGGGELALSRHAVAALLNASNPGIYYMFDVAGVIAMVQQAYPTGDFEVIKMTLAYQNEMGCSLD